MARKLFGLLEELVVLMASQRIDREDITMLQENLKMSLSGVVNSSIHDLRFRRC